MHKTSTYLILFFLLCFHVNMQGQQNDIYIKAGQLYDSKNNSLLQNKTVQVSGKKIVSVGEFDDIPENSTVIDLSGYTVLPGLIDAHTHVLFSQEAQEDFAAHSIQGLTMESDALRTLRGSKRAKSYLDEGFTSIKDLGNSGTYLDVALRDAINEGTIDGPRIFASGPILSAVGGQIYGVNEEHQGIIDLEYRIVKSPEDAKNAVREHVNQNVDVIKICADNLPNKSYLSVEEMASIVKTAHEYDLTVTAHCVTDTSAWNAIEAGVDGIEHGFNISDATLTRMAQENIFLVPTENSRAYMETYAKLSGYDDDLRWIESYIKNMSARLNSAIEKGVPIVAGSDNYTDIGTSRGQSSKDMLRYYFEAGMKPLDVLQSSTYLSALFLKKENEIGSFSLNSQADIIAVKGNVKTDFVNTMEQIVFVMKNGKIYINTID